MNSVCADLRADNLVSPEIGVKLLVELIEVAERGSSGGERRRLGLARAYLRRAPWLVLDEPTEGLDAISEARVVDRLRRRLDRTGQGLILISHRPAPRTLCDTEIRVLGLAADGVLTLAAGERRPDGVTDARTPRAPQRPLSAA